MTSDNLAGGRKAAEFLLAGGHGRIAHITGFREASTSIDRSAGFTAALEDAGVGLHALGDGKYDRATAAEAARAMMDRSDPPDAIFVANDHMALAVMDVLRFDLRLDVPGDVSIVGYDDVPMAAWPAYDLTTLRQPTRRMVQATVEELLANLDAPGRPARRIEIDGPLVVRRSARLPEGYEV